MSVPLITFWQACGVPMFAILGKLKFLRFLPSLRWYGIAFVDQLHDCHGTVFDWYTFKHWKRLDPRGSIPEWFKLSAVFFYDTSSLLASPVVSCDIGPLNIFDSSDFVSVCMVGCRASTAVFFEDIGLGLGVSMLGLMSSTLAKLQAIVLALECIPSSSSICLYSDSQAALDACKSKLISWHKVKGHSGILENECADAIAGNTFFSGWSLFPHLSEHFLMADSGIIGSGSKFLTSDLISEVNWLRSLLVWHPDLHMVIGFTGRSSANVHTYFIKILHYHLPVAVQKHLYDKLYPSVLCLYCGEIKVLDHIFFCKVDESAQYQLLDSHMGSWRALSGFFHSFSGILQLLSSCVFDPSMSTALFKGFVFNGWWCKAVFIFYDPKIAGLEIVRFACSLGAAFKENVATTEYRRYMEKLKQKGKKLEKLWEGEKKDEFKKKDELHELKKNLRQKKYKNKNKKHWWIEDIKTLEKQKEKLKKKLKEEVKELKMSKNRWELQMQKLQNMLMETTKTGLFLNETLRYYLQCWLNWAYPFAFYFDTGFTRGPSASSLQSSVNAQKFNLNYAMLKTAFKSTLMKSQEDYVNVFFCHLKQCTMSWMSQQFYAPYTLLVQASRTEKSRLLQELAVEKNILVIYICLRDPELKDYPNHLDIATELTGKAYLEAHYLVFLVALFCKCLGFMNTQL
ncbi:hypothetical protein G9A89_000790 [Geosiphon pyriformis]|nr:hypothetical protein G9A89_000790 [Geosiphon pyriformis]